MIQADNFNSIYFELLKLLYRSPQFAGIVTRKMEAMETLNLSFCLTDPTKNTIQSVARNPNMAYAEAFARYVVNGGENTDELIRLNPVAKRYLSDKHVKGHVVNYGKRIADQTMGIIKLLQDDPGSRRAVIHILEKSDNIIAHTKNATMEFPCAETLHFLIREDKLHCIVNMRSQNVPLVLVYDVYNFTAVQLYVAKQLGLAPGNYYHNMASAHIYARECELVEAILFEYTKQFKL